MNKFIARYEENGRTKSIAFDKSQFNEETAKEYLNHNGIKNFFFFFEPYEPTKFGENSYLFRGDVGFDITTEKLLPYLQADNEIILDSFGGDLWEGLKIYDAIKSMDNNPSIGVLGSCASAATLILLSTTNRWMSENSRFLIHNPWTWEAGDDEQFRKTANELEIEKNNIGRLYSKETGNSFEDMIMLMKEERFLSSTEAKEKKFVLSTNNKFTNLNENDMNNEEVEKKLSTLETMMNKIVNLFNKGNNDSPKNIIVQDVNGVEIDFGNEIESEEQIVTGLTGVMIDGQPAEGEYVLGDGTIYVFTGGELTEIREPETEEEIDVEALQAENASLKEQLSEVQNKLETANTDLSTMTIERDEIKNKLEGVETEFNTVKTEFEAIKNKFSDDKPLTKENKDEGEDKKVKFNYKSKK